MRYSSGRKKLRSFYGLSTSRYKYIGLDEVEPNLGYVNEKAIPVKDLYYQLVTFEGGGTFDRYWQALPPVGVVTGISIFNEGFLVGTANTVNKLNFVGGAINATASGSISTITVFAPGNTSELLFNNNSEFSTSNKLFFNENAGSLNVSNVFNVGTAGSIFTVSNSGNVGISSSTPTQALDINGNLRLYGTVYDNLNNPGNVGQILTKNNFNGVVWSSANSIRSGAGGTYTNLQYHNSAGLVDGVPFFVYDDVNQRIGIGSTQPSTFLDVTQNTRLKDLEVVGYSTFKDQVRFNEPVFFYDNTVIESDTNGTLLRLSLASPSTGGYALVIEDRIPGTLPDPSPFVINRIGHVGIGTTNPAGKLTVKGGNISLDNNNFLSFGTDNIALIRGADATDNGGYLGFRAGTGANDTIRLTGAGNLGIGTTTPQAKLDVIGSARITGKITILGSVTQTLPASVSPSENSQMSFELTNDTTLTVRVKGTDGTIRSGIITLSI
jgi:hypothetical protein